MALFAVPSITLGPGRYSGWKFEARLFQTIRLAIHRNDSINEAEYEGNNVAGPITSEGVHTWRLSCKWAIVLPLPPKSRVWNKCYEPFKGKKKRSLSKGRNGLCLRSENEGRYASLLGSVGLELFAEGAHIIRADRRCLARVCLTHCILSSVIGNLLFWGRVCGCFCSRRRYGPVEYACFCFTTSEVICVMLTWH